MKIQFTIVLALFTCHLFAQKTEYNFSFDYDYVIANQDPVLIEPTSPIKEIQFVITDKNNHQETQLKRYDESGNLIGYYREKKGEIIPLYKFEYNEAGLVVKSNAYKKGKLKHSISKKYDDNGNIIELKKVNSKGKTKLKNIWEYNENGCLAKTTRYKNDEKIKKYWVYEYREPCKKLKSTLYNAHGKTINTWNYDCNEEGEKISKKKKETPVCRWEETTDGYLIHVEETFWRRKAVKRVMKFTLEDTLIVEVDVLDNNDQLISKTTYNKSYDKPLVYSYYKNGKIRYQTTREYKNDRLIYYSHAKNNKINYRKQLTYTDDNQLIEVALWKKDKLLKKMEIRYKNI